MPDRGARGQGMIVRRGVLAMLGGGAALLLGGCGGRQGSLRYRLTLHVQTPQGERQGGGVVETRIALSPRWMGDLGGGSNDTAGDAPYVMLDDGRPLFALLSGRDWRDPMVDTLHRFLAYPDLTPPLSERYTIGDWPEAFDEARRVLPRGELRVTDYPVLATFTDPRDPSTAIEVDPADAGAALGSGRRVSAITLEVVPDTTPLTTGITAVLPWLTEQPDRNVSIAATLKPVADASLSESLVHGSFHRVRRQ